MNTFNHITSILPPPQSKLWPELSGAPLLGFSLYGGTAIALRLGHRESVDFDFFSDQPLDRGAICDAMPFLTNTETIQDQGDTWSVIWSDDSLDGGHVKLSFFGGISFGRVGEPEFTSDGVLQVASLDDLMAAKLKVILQRAEAKDYRDVAAMLNAGVSLSRGLASAQLFFGPNFQPMVSLKSLSYFKDGNLEEYLSPSEKRTLTNAVRTVSSLPEVNLLSNSLSGAPCDDILFIQRRLMERNIGQDDSYNAMNRSDYTPSSPGIP